MLSRRQTFAVIGAQCRFRSTGTVRKVLSIRGFGFVTKDGPTKEEAFFQVFNVKGAPFFLEPGDKVAYDVVSTPKGDEAVNITTASGEPFLDRPAHFGVLYEVDGKYYIFFGARAVPVKAEEIVQGDMLREVRFGGAPVMFHYNAKTETCHQVLRFTGVKIPAGLTPVSAGAAGRGVPGQERRPQRDGPPPRRPRDDEAGPARGRSSQRASADDDATMDDFTSLLR